jgi:hypothetical protein
MNPYNHTPEELKAKSASDTVDFVSPDPELVEHVRRTICLTRSNIRGNRDIVVFADSQGEPLPVVPRAWRMSTYPFAGKRDEDECLKARALSNSAR